jgi:predicted lipoprotein with Yx(FWY)xxD motif
MSCMFLFVYSCKKDTPDVIPPVVVEPMVKITANATLGNILTDEKGKTLYFFANDVNGSACTGACKDNWPVYFIDKLVLASGLTASDFATIEVAGIKQTTYKGWPLYYYKGDAQAGQATGEGSNDVWYVAKPDYTIMMMANQLTGHDGVQYNSQYKAGAEVVKYFVDDKGRTLYSFIKDFKDANTFTKADFSNNATWPIYETPSIGSVPSTLAKSDFGTIDVAGKKQLTYKGWPVYYFGQDNSTRGVNKGISFPSPGVWPIINASVAKPTLQPKVKEATHPTLGKILTDENGKTLYFFTKDVDGNSACTGGCLTNWPVYYIPSLKIEGSIKDTDFGTITKTDGTKQTTYKGWPLYYYAQDAAAGDVKGENVGTVWFVAKPDYSVMFVNAQLKGNDGVEYNSMYKPGQEVTQYLVDAYGRTLYGFKNDKYLLNKYTKADLSNNATWPLYEESKVNGVPSGLDKKLFQVITVFGKNQLTYNGWPLYYFGPDGTTRGPNKGVSVPTPGVWPIVNKNTTEAPCDAVTATFAGTVKPLLQKSCALSGCHTGAGAAAGFDFSTYAGVKSAATSGKLVGAISWTSGFKQMPQGGTQLDKCTIAAVKAWVDAGALDN